MRIQGIEGLDAFQEKEQQAIYKQVESRLFREDKLFLFLHFIRGFFPGLAILAFLEAYYRITAFRDNSLLTGFVLGAISIGVWIWVENYKSKQIAEVLPEILKEMKLSPPSASETA